MPLQKMGRWSLVSASQAIRTRQKPEMHFTSGKKNFCLNWNLNNTLLSSATATTQPPLENLIQFTGRDNSQIRDPNQVFTNIHAMPCQQPFFPPQPENTIKM